MSFDLGLLLKFRSQKLYVNSVIVMNLSQYIGVVRGTLVGTVDISVWSFVCMGYLWAPWLPSTVQKHAR